MQPAPILREGLRREANAVITFLKYLNDMSSGSSGGYGSSEGVIVTWDSRPHYNTILEFLEDYFWPYICIDLILIAAIVVTTIIALIYVKKNI